MNVEKAIQSNETFPYLNGKKLPGQILLEFG